MLHESEWFGMLRKASLSLNLVIIVLLINLLIGCAEHYTSQAWADPYGFFSGIWHGIIFPLTCIVNIISWMLSLIGVSFLNDIEIAGRPNIGLWYYVGFILGIGILSSQNSS